jgi:1-deoxy-D-xylulose-5-phosphate synthase
MYTAQLPEQLSPFSIRYPRGAGVMVDWHMPLEKIEIGKGRKLHGGVGLAILTIGTAGNLAAKAIKELNAAGIYPAHYDLRFAKPLDDALLHEVFQQYDRVLTVEDGILPGGVGSAVLEWMHDHGYQAKVKRLGIPDRVIEQATQQEQYTECGYDVPAIVAAAQLLLDAVRV